MTEPYQIDIVPIPQDRNPFPYIDNPMNIQINGINPMPNAKLFFIESVCFYTYTNSFGQVAGSCLTEFENFCLRYGIDVSDIAYNFFGVQKRPQFLTCGGGKISDNIVQVTITGTLPTWINDDPCDRAYDIGGSGSCLIALVPNMGFNFIWNCQTKTVITIDQDIVYDSRGQKAFFWNPQDSFPPTRNFTVASGVPVIILDPILVTTVSGVSPGISPVIKLKNQPVPPGDFVNLTDLLEIDPQTQSGDSRLSTQWWVVVADDGPGSKRFLDLSVEPYRFATGKIYPGDVLSTITIPRRQLEAATPDHPLKIWACNAKTPIPGVCSLTKD